MRSESPAIMVLDWRLPTANRREIIDVSLAAASGRPPILALLPDDDGTTIEGALEVGCNDYLVIPATSKDIETKLRFLGHRVGAAYELVESNRLLRSALDRFVLACGGQDDGIWDWDVGRNTVYYSPRWKEMLGYVEGEIGNSPDHWFDLVHTDDRERLKTMIDANLAGSMTPLEHRYRIRHRDGDYRWMLTRAEMLRDDGGAVHRIVGRQIDVDGTEDEDGETRVGGLHDPLTKLPNRTVLVDRLRNAFARAVREPSRPFAVLFFDLDRFKNVNDSLGHLAGDKLLASIAHRVRATCRPADTVARFGGDEFVIIVEDITDIRGDTVARARSRKRPSPVRDRRCRGLHTVSIGIAVWNPVYEKPKTCSVTPTPRCTAPRTWARTATRCSTSRCTRRSWTLKLENDLRRAIARKEFRVLLPAHRDPHDGGISASRRWSDGNTRKGPCCPAGSSVSPKRWV